MEIQNKHECHKAECSKRFLLVRKGLSLDRAVLLCVLANLCSEEFCEFRILYGTG